MHFETLAVHAGQPVDPATGAVTQPIHVSTTFERATDGAFPHGNIYIRNGNPTRSNLETALAALEDGHAAVSFASGMAAIHAVLQALEPGAHVVAPLDAYYGTMRLLTTVCARWGLETTFVDQTDLDAVRAAMRPATRLVWAETPSNPNITVSDLAALAEIAHAHGALLGVDNTWATPVLTRPLALGADIAMHSTTKYLGGHSDLLGGAVVVREGGELLARLREVQTNTGAVQSPFDAWLLLRGIRSLPWRMRAHCANARAIAHALDGHPKLERVCYPGLPGDPGHAVAARQMADFGGMLSIVVRGGEAGAFAVANRLRLFTRATSLGGPESLVEHRASIEGEITRAAPGLLRLSVGLEHPDDLIGDLRGALEAV